MRPWDEIARESDRVIGRAMAERRAYESDCTCGAVDVEGASHLDWCLIVTSEAEDAQSPREPLASE